MNSTETRAPNTDDHMAPQHLRSIRSFVLRQGHLSKAQARALEELMPIYGLPFSNQRIDFQEVFQNNAPTILEIGSGMGGATVDIAKNQPDKNFIAIEVHSPGVGSLLNLIHQHGLKNLRVIQHDAVEVLEQMIAKESLSGVHIFFPDPWPKKRHHKRRIIQPPFVAKIAEKLQKNAYLHLATDWEAYAQHMLEVCSADENLRNPHDDFAPKPDYRPLTKFEARGLARGHGVWDCIFLKR